jgi:Zn-dependent protease
LAAGPANLLLAVLLLGLTNLYFDPTHPVLWAGVAFLGFLQVTAVLLNLLPIPGLDGYNALEPHLSPETQRALEPFKPYGVLILLLIFFAPVLNRWFFGMVFWLYELSGVPSNWALAGMELTKIWHAWF